MSTASPVSGLECSVAYINGRVWTVDSANSCASGFIVSEDGLFTHVGTSDEIQSIAKEHHLVTVDLKNTFTMPGIHDAHMHLLFSGLGITSSAIISPEATHLDIAQQVKTGSCACEYINAYQDWVLAGAYNNQGFPDGLADRKYLDHLYPDTPVMVRGGAGHAVLLNTAALKKAGYDVENEPDAHATRFLRREDGSLTGEMAENAMAKAFIALPFPDRAHVKRALKHAIWLAHKAGVTSTQEASSNTALLRALSEMEKEGSLKLDICTHIVYNCEWLGSESKDNLNKLLETAKEYKSKHVDTRFVKIMLDGVPLPPLWTQAGIDEQGNVEHGKITTPDVADAILRFDQEGRTVKVHCAGSGAARLALDAIEKARKANPNGPRHELAHNSSVTDEDYKRYQPLNITAEMSPAELFVNPMTAGNPHIDFDVRRMLDHGVHTTIGSDWGAVPDPCLLEALGRIAESVGQGDKAEGGKILCRLMTINGAEAVGRQSELGSIEVGKKANFILVSQDLSKGEFEGAKVLRTYFEGEEVWNIDR